MASQFSREDRDRFLGWLGHGAGLAWELKKEQARHSDVIWSLLVEAVDLLDRTPDQEKRWLTSGTRSGGWNMVGLTPQELKEIEKLRTLSAMKPYDGTAKYAPQRNDLERALGVLEWLRWCNGTRNSQRLVKAAIALARGGDTEAVHRIYHPNKNKRDRRTIYEIRTRVTGYILSGLRKDCGIVPGEWLSFQEVPIP